MAQKKELSFVGLVCLMLTLCHPVAAQTDAAAKESPKATIDQIAWIAGDWHGEAMGGKFEEAWNPPMGGAMMGMFKFVDGGKIGFYELLTIVPKGDSLVLRLKHFDANLKGWEEKDKSVEFPLLELSDRVAKFDGLKFKKISSDRMDIIVAVEQGSDKPAEELKFECHRRRTEPAAKDD